MNPELLRDALWRLAANHRWTWVKTTSEILDELPGARPGHHPVATIDSLTNEQLARLADDSSFVERVGQAIADLDASLAEAPAPTIAYCSPEFGITAAFPQYAGGLGILAGDHLKTASDLGTPIVGVGLLYSEGVFRQVIDEGRQTEAYRRVDPRLVGAIDTGTVVAVPFPHREVHARVWRIDVGNVPLLLLDTDVEQNGKPDRRITDRLYAGSRQHRLEQELVLGVGGAKALAALGFDVVLHHLNEGHAGFITLELIDRHIEELGFDRAVDEVRESLVFTTHTPVPAGIDRFADDLIRPYLEVWTARWQIAPSALWELGADPSDQGKFNMAALCLRTTRIANGVSELHGQVSRKLFAGVGIGDEIGFVTNGVHARTWTAWHLQDLFDTHLGGDWAQGAHEAWQRVSAIDDEALLEARRRSSLELAALVEERTGTTLDPDALIVGFARRFAPYKRANLILKRPDLLAELLEDETRPVHFVFAGKAHPTDETGKGLVAEIIRAGLSDDRITFLPDYEMDIARAMVQGADIWLNNPIRPREASGTSGEKAALNGVLNCSILDGWWAEMYDGRNGWDITPSESHDPDHRDHEEATTTLERLAAISVEYHSARPVFLGRIRHAWASLGPRVTAARMMRDYETRVYELG